MSLLKSLDNIDLSLQAPAIIPAVAPQEQIYTLEIRDYPYTLPVLTEILDKSSGITSKKFTQPAPEASFLPDYLDNFGSNPAANAQMIAGLLAKISEYDASQTAIDSTKLFTAVGTAMQIVLGGYTYAFVSRNLAPAGKGASPYGVNAQSIFRQGHEGLVLVREAKYTGEITTDKLPMDYSAWSFEQKTLFKYGVFIGYAYTILTDSAADATPMTVVMDANAQTIVANALKTLQINGLGALSREMILGKDGKLRDIQVRRRIIAPTPITRERAYRRGLRAALTLSDAADRDSLKDALERAYVETPHYLRIKAFFETYVAKDDGSSTEKELWAKACKNA